MRKMIFKSVCTLVGVLAVAVATAQTASAQQRGGWESLGCVDVGRRPDSDVIKVGIADGRFEAIRAKAIGNDVSILDLKVVYGNGQPDDIRVRSELREGAETRPLDLTGRDRAIRRIEITTRRDFKGRGKGRARLCIDGRRKDRRTDNWEQLGCQKVGFRTDRDTIKVGRREGRFKAIRLEVSGNAVYIMDLKVVYGGGAVDDIRVRSEIRDGGRSGPLDLRGRNRAIDRIELVYRAKPNFQGSARVCVSGR